MNSKSAWANAATTLSWDATTKTLLVEVPQAATPSTKEVVRIDLFMGRKRRHGDHQILKGLEQANTPGSRQKQSMTVDSTQSTSATAGINGSPSMPIKAELEHDRSKNLTQTVSKLATATLQWECYLDHDNKITYAAVSIRVGNVHAGRTTSVSFEIAPRADPSWIVPLLNTFLLRGSTALTPLPPRLPGASAGSQSQRITLNELEFHDSAKRSLEAQIAKSSSWFGLGLGRVSLKERDIGWTLLPAPARKRQAAWR
ncbi:hypothetical protein PYCC9005_005004 [Savitreella phatthalungensis]